MAVVTGATPSDTSGAAPSTGPASGPTPAGAGRPSADGSTRNRLVEAAIAVFRRDGYERARVTDIARAAGLTTGAIYANFRDKAELLLAAIARCSAAEMAELLGRTGDRDPEEVLRRLAARLVTPRAERPLLLDAVAAAPRDPDLAGVLRDALADRRARLEALHGDLTGRGALDPAVDRDAFVHLCVTLALGSVVARALEVPLPQPDAWAALIDRLLAGVAAEPGGPGGLDEPRGPAAIDASRTARPTSRPHPVRQPT